MWILYRNRRCLCVCVLCQTMEHLVNKVWGTEETSTKTIRFAAVSWVRAKEEHTFEVGKWLVSIYITSCVECVYVFVWVWGCLCLYRCWVRDLFSFFRGSRCVKTMIKWTIGPKHVSILVDLPMAEVERTPTFIFTKAESFARNIKNGRPLNHPDKVIYHSRGLWFWHSKPTWRM